LHPIAIAEIATPTQAGQMGQFTGKQLYKTLAMVKRVAKQGVNVGNAFWGCSEFPTCRGIRSI